METLKPEICVIGGGKAGRAAAQAAAALGVTAVLVDHGGLGGSLSAIGVRIIKGHAAFKDKRTLGVQVTGVDGNIEIRARRFIIATGTTPAAPAIPALDNRPYLTGTSILDVERPPPRLVVIGDDPSAVELAQTFRRRGSDVTLCASGPLLPNEDPEGAAIVIDQLVRDGVVLSADLKIDDAQLLVTARKPMTDGLNLEAAGIRFDTSGIIINKKLKTSNSRVYAIGGCAIGLSGSTHAGEHQAVLAVRHALFGEPVNIDSALMPSAIFTTPELAQTGLSEAEARKRGIKFRILRAPFYDNDRAQAEHATHGHVKVIVENDGIILGAMIVGAQAAELINLWTLAIRQKLNIKAISSMVIPYPSLSEIGKRVAADYVTPRLTKPFARRILRWLRVFG